MKNKRGLPVSWHWSHFCCCPCSFIFFTFFLFVLVFETERHVAQAVLKFKQSSCLSVLSDWDYRFGAMPSWFTSSAYVCCCSLFLWARVSCISDWPQTRWVVQMSYPLKCKHEKAHGLFCAGDWTLGLSV